ncbi:hypothetical protein EJ04DRAFT_167656 [Polyplosphaeria fusca]|uniref:Uncharacterized protein n=1 Tax=Polyplosphaeria fusca TaxID=682080 RepID=A0A9P4V7F1_9PLEO|nr:hypothetical protein EJ04DRAFT_167656 [Polyplosphaeria fusca]
MSGLPSQPPSPSNSNPNPPKNSGPSDQQAASTSTDESHRPDVHHSLPSPGISLSTTTGSDLSAPRIVITEPASPSRSSQRARTEEPPLRQGRTLVSRHRSGHSSSQPPRRSSTPYARPRTRSQSQDTRTATSSAMSSASSSPGNTATSGTSGPYTSTTGSNPGYHLPYAPFPYPMPGNARGGGSNTQGSGSGK